MTLIRVLKCYKNSDFSRKRPIQVAFTADDIAETLSIGLGRLLCKPADGKIISDWEKERYDELEAEIRGDGNA